VGAGGETHYKSAPRRAASEFSVAVMQWNSPSRKEKSAAKERSFTVLRFASFPRSIVKRLGGVVFVVDGFEITAAQQWPTHAEGAFAQLSHPQPGSHPGHLTRDINPHLTFSVSFLTSLQKHPLYANPWKQWRLARG
jgi:hypothetical protein